MNLRRTIIHGLFYGSYLFHKITGTGPFGPGGAVYFQAPLGGSENPLKKALIRHHVKQYHEASCSVASVVTVVNALKDIQGDGAQPITQAEILRKVRTGYWKERMSPQGHNGRRGLPLPLLGEIVKSSLHIYGIAYQTIETIPGTRNPELLENRKKELRNRLKDFETRGGCLIIAHFGQGVFVRSLNIPHISPVGGFDIQSAQVTILDVDPDQDKPYRVPFETFCSGIFSNYHPVLRLFGYRTGGYVFVGLDENSFF